MQPQLWPSLWQLLPTLLSRRPEGLAPPLLPARSLLPRALQAPPAGRPAHRQLPAAALPPGRLLPHLHRARPRPLHVRHQRLQVPRARRRARPLSRLLPLRSRLPRQARPLHVRLLPLHLVLPAPPAGQPLPAVRLLPAPPAPPAPPAGQQPAAQAAPAPPAGQLQVLRCLLPALRMPPRQ